jgi:hypothetical protein
MKWLDIVAWIVLAVVGVVILGWILGHILRRVHRKVQRREYESTSETQTQSRHIIDDGVVRVLPKPTDEWTDVGPTEGGVTLGYGTIRVGLEGCGGGGGQLPSQPYHITGIRTERAEQSGAGVDWHRYHGEPCIIGVDPANCPGCHPEWKYDEL